MGTSPSANKKNVCDDGPECRYTDEQVCYIRHIYITFAISWIALVIYFQLYNYDSIMLIIVLMPPLIFLYTYIILPELDRSIETDIFQSNYLSITLLIVIPLFFNLSSKVPWDPRPMSMVIIAIIAILLGIVDIWIPKSLLPVARHIKSGFETIGVFLLIAAVYIYFTKMNAMPIAQQPYSYP